MPDVGNNNMEGSEVPLSPVAPPGRPASRTSPRDSTSQVIYTPFFTGRPRTPTSGLKHETMDRQEIIRKIKEKSAARQKPYEADVNTPERQAVHDRSRATGGEIVLLPSPEIDFTHEVRFDDTPDNGARGLEISRPRSALHRGDFRGDAQSDARQNIADSPRPSPRLPSSEFAATSPPAPWHEGFPNTSVHRSRRYLSTPPSTAFDGIRPRAMSGASLSHSFSYQAPTSPLVNQSNAEDLNDEFTFAQRPQAFDLSGRRGTFSPASSFAAFGEAHSAHSWYSPPASLRRESTIAYQAHQPRRSITSIHSLPQSPVIGGRRSSGFGSSPLQSSMVGSFEESILKGRMSTTPSRPLDFTAHIGVLGMGDCKPSLKCPPHIIVPFPAVFYSYGHGNNTHDSQPRPYVGLVDLENAAPKDTTSRRKSRVRGGGEQAMQRSTGVVNSDDNDSQRRRKQKNKRRSNSPLDEPKGAYRIPPKGQLQIIIKNPNKTAVKLFLVPYDVTDMLPGQKTFIRQRSYSAGSIIDLAPHHQIASLQDRPALRYLIHLHICCTSQGRFWLYNSIRVVFANRVPDGKEKLRNETQLPEPKYSSYRPHRNSAGSTALVAAQLDGTVPMDLDTPDRQTSAGKVSYAVRPHRSGSHSLPGQSHYDTQFVKRQRDRSFYPPGLEPVLSRPTSRGLSDEHSDEGKGLALLPAQPLSPTTDSSEGTGSFTFSRSSSSEKLQGTRAESLLSRRLRDLEMSRTGSVHHSVVEEDGRED